MANSVCDIYKAQNLVCPPTLKDRLFTVAAADNIDHNLSSSTAHNSFHGTAISIMQFPTESTLNIHSCFSPTASDSVSDISLPASYTEILPCMMPSKIPPIQPSNISLAETAYISTSRMTGCML